MNVYKCLSVCVYVYVSKANLIRNFSCQWLWALTCSNPYRPSVGFRLFVFVQYVSDESPGMLLDLPPLELCFVCQHFVTSVRFTCWWYRKKIILFWFGWHLGEKSLPLATIIKVYIFGHSILNEIAYILCTFMTIVYWRPDDYLQFVIVFFFFK